VIEQANLHRLESFMTADGTAIRALADIVLTGR
jgi:hypothetical protein